MLSPVSGCQTRVEDGSLDGGETNPDISVEPLDPSAPQKNPSLDNSPTAIFNYLKNNSYILKYGSVDSKVTRGEFAANAVFYSGFYEYFNYYYPLGDYSDMDRFSEESKFAEIAVNQGYMKKPENGIFSANESITYEEVMRGYLYILGYREYADKVGVMPLASALKLNEHISSSKARTDSITYGEFSQITYNAFYIPLVQCIEKDGDYSTVRKDGFYIVGTYVSRDESLAESEPIFKLANNGWDIYPGGSYKYGPSIMLNEDGSIDVWLATHSGIPVEIDYGVYRRSYDGGKSWTSDVNAIMPTGGSQDWNWTCDPSVIKIGDWYYAAYTSTPWHDGIDNNLFIARSKTPGGPFMEKWTGNGWGTRPVPVVAYDGGRGGWGAGEGSFTVVDGTIYIYSTWTCGEGNFTYVYSAPANDENWPSKVKYQGLAYNRSKDEDSTEVKYVDAYNAFISVATASRFSNECYINVRTSFDGRYFRRETAIRHNAEGSHLMTCIHNMGISANSNGHIDIFSQNYVSYAYQPEGSLWGNWPTRFAPIAWIGTELYEDPSKAVKHSSGLALDTTHVPQINGTRLLNTENFRLFRANSTSHEMVFYIQEMSSTGSWNGIPEAEYKNVVFYHDSSKLFIDKTRRVMRLLVPEIQTVSFSYKGLTGYFTVVPDFVDHSKPAYLYPEKSVLTITRKGEAKQPGFIAESLSGDFLVLWGMTSSYKDANNKDQPDYIKNWQQTITLSGWDENIVSVDLQTGKIYGKAVGTTQVTATYMGLTATVTVVVETA